MRMTQRIIMCLVASLLLMGVAHATTYYVATNGNDNNAGTSGSPFRTIQKGIDVAVAGDIVHVRPGSYQEHLSITHGGTSNAPLTIEGEAGAIVDGSFPNFTPSWTLVSGYGGGVYECTVPAETNCVSVNDQLVADLWWGQETWPTGTGCRPWALGTIHRFHYQRMFQYSYADVAGWPSASGYEATGPAMGWDGIQGMELWFPGNTLWVKCKPGASATPLDISQQSVKIAPADVPLVDINGASNLVIRGITFKYAYWGMALTNSVDNTIENCVLKPVYNGIKFLDGAGRTIVRYCEISANIYHQMPGQAERANVRGVSKDMFTDTRVPYSADKFMIYMQNGIGGNRFHDNYIHDGGVGFGSGWRETDTNWNGWSEFDHNKLEDLYQDAVAIGGNCAEFKIHDNLWRNCLQIRFMGFNFGPTYVYRNFMIDGVTSDDTMAFYGDADAPMADPQLYLYNNTMSTSSTLNGNDWSGSFFMLNGTDAEGYENFHLKNNLCYGDSWYKSYGGNSPDWDGNYNVFAKRTSWGTPGTTCPDYNTSYGVDLNSYWSTSGPGFVDFANGNYALTSSSPARNKGTSLGLPGSSTDCGALAYGQSMPTLPRTSATAEAPILKPLTNPQGIAGVPVTLAGVNLANITSVTFDSSQATGLSPNHNGTALTCTPPAHANGTVNVTATNSAGTSNTITFTYVSSTATTLYATADVMVWPSANTNNGNNMQTQYNANGPWGIIKFDLSSVSGTVTSALLKINNWTNTTAHAVNVYGTTDSWTESTNWSNKPTRGSSLASASVSSAGWYQWDVTSYVAAEVAGDKAASFYLNDLNDSGAWNQWGTRENGAANGPQLLVSTGSGGGGSAPTLSSINPTSGTTAGGTACTLAGGNFISGATVSFGGTAGTSVVVDSASQIRCTSPAKSAGTISVTVTTSNGTSGGQNYTFVTPPSPPTLSSITPNNGSTAGGTACTLAGTYLTDCSAVSFGGTAATGIVVDSASQVRCTSPAKAQGTYSVTATTPGGTSGGVNYTFNAPVPTLSAINPNSGTTAGGTAVTLTGTGLIGCTGVSFGGTAGTGIVVDSASQVRCTSPARSAGGVNVTATTPGGTSNAMTYTYSSTQYTTTLTAVADSMVSSSSPTSNWGNDNNCQLQQTASTYLWPILKFDLASVQGSTITSAKLRVYKQTSTTAYTCSIFGSTGDDSWIETGVTWNNKPAKGSSQATLSVGSPNWYEWTITSFVNSKFAGNKKVTVYMTDEGGTNRWTQWRSRQYTSYEPKLVVISQ